MGLKWYRIFNPDYSIFKRNNRIKNGREHFPGQIKG